MIDKQMSELLSGIDDIRALLILLLRKSNVEGKDVAKALGMSEGSVSKLLDKAKYGGK